MNKESYKIEESEELIDFVIRKARSADILMTLICIKGMGDDCLRVLNGMETKDQEILFIINELKSFITLFKEINIKE